MKNAEILGRLTNASNATLLVENSGRQFVYKPKSGERRLWDFPEGTLYKRERAAYVLSELLGWGLIPATTIDDGPLGVGSFQVWVDAQVSQVDIFTQDQIPKDWLVITSGIDETGQPVTLAHSDSFNLMQITLFDAIANNGDRKAGHLLTDPNNFTWAIDHGVTFNVEPKLRTVLWGWIGQEIPEDLLNAVDELTNKVSSSELIELLDEDEILALQNRIEILVISKKFPEPNKDWPAVPWPIF